MASPHSEETLAVKIARAGYVFLRRHEVALDAKSVAASLGVVLTPWPGHDVQHLVPRTGGTPNTYGGMFGLRRFPYHTDLAHWQTPPPYLMLRCVKGFPDVPTTLLDGMSLADHIGRDLLRRAVVRPRRPRSGTIYFLRLLEERDSSPLLLRWDEVFLEPASRVGQIAFQTVREYLEKAAPRSITLESAGDTLIIDNTRMLHSRTPIPPGRESRHIERVYIEDLS